MNASRAIFLALGIAFILVGVYLMFFEANLDRWVSIGVLTAGVLVFVGVLVMGFAGNAPADPPREVARSRDRDTPVVIDQRRRAH